MKSKRQNRRCATGVLQILLCLGCGGGFAFANADEPISLEQAEARGIWTTAKIKMPLRYDNPLTPQIECLSVFQTPAYKLMVDGHEEWFRDHYIVAEYEDPPNTEDRKYWLGGWDFDPGLRTLEAAQHIAGAYGIKSEAAEKYAYASSFGVFGMNVTMCKQHGGKTHPVIVDRYRFVEPTRVPAKPPRAWEGPPEFAKHPELELLRGTDVWWSRFDPQPEMEHEVLTDVVEIVDVGPKWDNPETAGVERYRIWRGGSHFVQKDHEWYEMRDWFLVSEEDLTIWAEEGPVDPFESEEEKQRRKPKPISSFGMEPWDLPLVKAVEMATRDVKLAKFEEDNPTREEDPFGFVDPDLRDYDDYGAAGAQLVHRTFKGKPITLWCVLVAKGRVRSGLEVFDDCEARFILMNGKIIRPVKLNVLPLLSERRNQDPEKFRLETERLWNLNKARENEIKRLDELGKTQK